MSARLTLSLHMVASTIAEHGCFFPFHLLLLSVPLEPLSRGPPFPNDHVFGKSNLDCTGRLIANNIPVLYDRVSRAWIDDVASHIRQSGT